MWWNRGGFFDNFEYFECLVPLGLLLEGRRTVVGGDWLTCASTCAGILAVHTKLKHYLQIFYSVMTEVKIKTCHLAQIQTILIFSEFFSALVVLKGTWNSK